MEKYLTLKDPKTARRFLSPDFEVKDWPSLEPYYQQLLDRSIHSQEDMVKFLKDRDELGAVLQEDRAWRYIRQTRDTQNEELKNALMFFVKEISPNVIKYEDKLNKKCLESPYFEQLPDAPYLTFKRQTKREIEIYREENFPLSTQAKELRQAYQAKQGGLTITHGEETLTPQQASKLLESQDRDFREAIWHKVNEAREGIATDASHIFDQLVKLRHKMAQNADYPDFTSYQFDALGRFDYTTQDVSHFHDAIEKEVTPVYLEMMKRRKEILGVEKLRPWDLLVDIYGEDPLTPFQTAQELKEKAITVLSNINPALGKMLEIMDQREYLDLESRVGKAPGGYNYPLLETGIPFIFMNAAGSQMDVTTMFHESGHAVHSFVTKDIVLNSLKYTPSEVAELASMAMELLCLDQYHVVYRDEQIRRRAMKQQLDRCIDIFPWIATIDAFQQWVYIHPNASEEDRHDEFFRLYKRFHGDLVDWTGYEDILRKMWLKQGHVFEMPFYYIEYAIAQLGALAVWRNYHEDAQKGLDMYLEALQLGYTQPIPAIYAQAGIQFDFSPEYVRECVQYCVKAYEAIKL